MMPRHILATVLLLMLAGSVHAAEPAQSAKRDPKPGRPAPAVLADPGIRGLETAVRRADGALVIRQRLGGKGEIRDRGHHVIEGTLAPGDSPGCVTDQGNVTFTGSSTLEIELGGPDPCTGYDRLSVLQTLTLQSSRLRVLLISGFTPAAGQRFDILDWGSLSGTFQVLELPALPAPLTWDTTALYTSGELVVAAPVKTETDVPLPGWALAALAVALGRTVMQRARRR